MDDQYQQPCSKCGTILDIDMPIAIMTQRSRYGRFLKEETVCYKCKDEPVLWVIGRWTND